MLKIGQKVKRNPNYIGSDHSPGWRKQVVYDYYKEIGEVTGMTKTYPLGPIVKFPSGVAAYPNWMKSLIEITPEETSLLEGFEEDLFKI